jgi:hypothetical protein
MVTTKDMRLFARDCRRWGREISNPSDRAHFFRAAQTWNDIATEIDHSEGHELGCKDLRTKLN